MSRASMTVSDGDVDPELLMGLARPPRVDRLVRTPGRNRLLTWGGHRKPGGPFLGGGRTACTAILDAAEAHGLDVRSGWMSFPTGRWVADTRVRAVSGP